MTELIYTTLGMISKLLTKINNVISNTVGITGTYDSTSVTSNRDGNLFQRTEFVIDSLLSAPPVRVTQSDALTIAEGVYAYFNVQIYDIDGNPYLEEDINITSGLLTLEKSTLGGAFSIIGITQPVLQKGLGHIDTSILFKTDEWAPDDLYRVTLSSVTVVNGVTHTLQTFVWNNYITIVNDIDAEIDTILHNITVPDIDNLDNESIADLLGQKGDTPKSDLTATIMNNLKALFASSLSKRIRVSEVVNTTSFKTTDLPALGSGGLIGWYVFCSLDAGGIGGAPQGEYRLISNWSNGVSGIFTHDAFSTPLTTSDKVMIVHPSIYNMISMMPEIAKIEAIKIAVNAITGYALDSTVAKASTLSLVKTETDKISVIKTIVEAITGYALDSTVAKATTLSLVKTETDKIDSVIAYSDKNCPIKVSTSLTTQNLFTISGGGIEVLRIVGYITTPTQASNNNTKLVFTSTGGTAVDLCGVNNMNNKGIRKVISITKVKNDAMLVSTDEGVVVVTTSNQLILMPGVISLNCATVTSGVISWQIHYRPITPDSIVT